MQKGGLDTNCFLRKATGLVREVAPLVVLADFSVSFSVTVMALIAFCMHAAFLASIAYMAFILLILGELATYIEIYTIGVTLGQIAVLFFGISSLLVIRATEPFVQAEELDGFRTIR